MLRHTRITLLSVLTTIVVLTACTGQSTHSGATSGPTPTPTTRVTPTPTPTASWSG